VTAAPALWRWSAPVASRRITEPPDSRRVVEPAPSRLMAVPPASLRFTATPSLVARRPPSTAEREMRVGIALRPALVRGTTPRESTR
jgi:hypothetical protein